MSPDTTLVNPLDGPAPQPASPAPPTGPLFVWRCAVCGRRETVSVKDLYRFASAGWPVCCGRVVLAYPEAREPGRRAEGGSGESSGSAPEALPVARGRYNPVTDTLNLPDLMPTPQNDPKAQAAWLGAFADPTRLAILRTLATGEKTVTELARACGVEIVNASHHLNLMKGIGVLTATRDGRFMRYSLVGATATATLLELTHESGIEVVIPLG
jgi:ArsR family transcriptional regulator, nickel/cobalt-responsive transcriptional repressor